MSSSIQVLERALDILSLISESEREMGISEIARIMNLHKSTVHRTVYTMCKKDYLYQNKRTSEYSLGKKAFLLGFRAISTIPVAEVARPYMAFLSEKYREHITMDIFHKGYTLTISYYLGNYSSTFYSLDNYRGIKSPHRPAVVYCMMAYQTSLEPNDRFLVEYKTSQNMRKQSSMNDFIKELEEVRKKGYAFEDEEFRVGEICYAAPLFETPEEQVNAVGTISISGNKSSFGNFPEDELIKDIKYAASMISSLWKPIAEYYSDESEHEDINQ